MSIFDLYEGYSSNSSINSDWFLNAIKDAEEIQKKYEAKKTVATTYSTRYENGTHYFDLTVPGAKKEEFSVTYDAYTKTLTIDGEYKSGAKIRQKVLFTGNIDPDSFTASYEDGILYITAKDKTGTKIIVPVS